jgi:hypothetical protein
MSNRITTEDRDRLDIEVENLERWYNELAQYLEEGLKDPGTSLDEYSNAATMATRVLIRLKTLYAQLYSLPKSS